MPYMVSDQPIHVSDNGVDAFFQAGVTRFIRPSLQSISERCGARVVEQTPASSTVQSSEGVPDDSPTDEQVRDAILAIMDSGDTKAFDAQQIPKTRAIGKQLGQRVTAAQRDRVWADV